MSIGIDLDTNHADTPSGVSRVRLSREQTAERRRALGEFIRSRRERTTPAMVGLPPGPRRRTPGLRREEVALLAGIGITWYTWLEQGRSVNVSSQVLLSVVRVLGMNDTERAHVFTLADLPDPEHRIAVSEVGAAVQVMLDQLNPLPATLIGPRLHFLIGNHAHRALVGDYMAVTQAERNLVWLYFTDPEWRYMTEDWAATAKKMVAKLRAATAMDAGDRDWDELLGRLRAESAEFRVLWQRHDVAGMEGTTKLMRHRVVGTLDIEVVHLLVGDQSGSRITVYTPRDDETRRRMERLADIEPRRIVRPGETAAPVPRTA